MQTKERYAYAYMHTRWCFCIFLFVISLKNVLKFFERTTFPEFVLAADFAGIEFREIPQNLRNSREFLFFRKVLCFS